MIRKDVRETSAPEFSKEKRSIFREGKEKTGLCSANASSFFTLSWCLLNIHMCKTVPATNTRTPQLGTRKRKASEEIHAPENFYSNVLKILSLHANQWYSLMVFINSQLPSSISNGKHS